MLLLLLLLNGITLLLISITLLFGVLLVGVLLLLIVRKDAGDVIEAVNHLGVIVGSDIIEGEDVFLGDAKLSAPVGKIGDVVLTWSGNVLWFW